MKSRDIKGLAGAPSAGFIKHHHTLNRKRKLAQKLVFPPVPIRYYPFQMASPKQTVLLIAGGWHTPETYGKLTKTLEASGFEVHCPRNPSLNGSRPPNADLETDTANVRSYAENLLKDGRTITVLMHSYGGQIGTNALHGLGVKDRANAGQSGGIAHLIYMTTAATTSGKSMVDMVKHHGHMELIPVAINFDDDKTCVSADPKTLLIGADSGLPDAEIEEYISTLVRWNGDCMYMPLTTPREPWRDIPVTYIFTTKDMTLPFDYQKCFVDGMRENGVEVQTTTLETGHCPNLDAPEKITEIVEKVVAGEKLDDGSGQGGSEASQATVVDAIRNVGTKMP